MLIDSHCHLDYEKDNIDNIIEDAKNKNVQIMQTICTSKNNIKDIIKIIDKYNCVYGSIGIHPLNVKEDGIMSYKEIMEHAKHKKIIGIGETGLDYHYQQDTKKEQQLSFIEHLKASAKTGLPAIIHSRDAENDTINIMKQQISIAPFSGVMHCFTSSMDLAIQSIECGMYISFSGIITFKKTDYLHKILKITPINKILIETDSPYLSPEPYRGKKNSPSMLPNIAKKISEILSMPYQEIENITTNNFYKLFSKTLTL